MDDTVEIPLRRKGEVVAYAIVDADDYARVAGITWWLHGKGCAQGHVAPRTPRMMHRIILDAPDDMTVDHINHNQLDNRRSNLRLATIAENNQNRWKRGGTSEYRGVCRCGNRWRAQACLGGRQVHIGYFLDEKDAARAAAEWRRDNMPFSLEALGVA